MSAAENDDMLIHNKINACSHLFLEFVNMVQDIIDINAVKCKSSETCDASGLMKKIALTSALCLESALAVLGWNTALSVAYLGGGGLCDAPPPFGRTAVIFVAILGLFLAPFRDKIVPPVTRCVFGQKML